MFVRLIFKFYKMKKLLTLFLGLTILSCSSEDQVNQEVSALENSGSVLDGKMLSFKDEELFVKEYSDLAALNVEELKNWASSKKIVSLLNSSEDSASMEEDILSETRIVYSDALKTILNSESKVKIDGKVLWLNERTFYLLSKNQINKTSEQLVGEKEVLKVYGSLLSLSGRVENSTARGTIPNENRIKTFVSAEVNVNGSRLRHVVDLYNETIVLNGITQSSKMYIRSTLQYRSCSTWKCTWKEAQNYRELRVNCICPICWNGSSPGAWIMNGNEFLSGFTGTQTVTVANWNPIAPQDSYVNFQISGTISSQLVGVPESAMSVDVSWY